MALIAPAPLNLQHDLSDFVCEHESLTMWLQKRALKNQQTGASRCFVVCEDAHVIGYCALAAGSVTLKEAPGRVSRNMPDPIPVAVLGRLAIHHKHTGKGLGSGLLKDAILRCQRVATDLGTRAMLCHSIDERAKAFYMRHGFVESPSDSLTVMLVISYLAANP